jgi:hypothetical protein
MSNMHDELWSLWEHIGYVSDLLDHNPVSVNWFGTVEPRTEAVRMNLRNMKVWLTDLLDHMVEPPEINTKPREH